MKKAKGKESVPIRWGKEIDKTLQTYRILEHRHP